MRMVRQLIIAAAVAVGITASAPANASQILRSDSFSFAGTTTDSVGFQEFDPTLGTLDSVSISIIGDFSAQVVVGPGAAFTPAVDLGIAKVGPHGFSFDGTAQFFFAPVVDLGPPISSGHYETIATNFALTFLFSSASDLVGFTVPNGSASAGVTFMPPFDAAAQRSDFAALPPLGAIGINEVLQLTPANFVPLAGFNGGGSIVVTYDYTPAPVAVPAPPAALILVLGLAFTAARRRRAIATAGPG